MISYFVLFITLSGAFVYYTALFSLWGWFHYPQQRFTPWTRAPRYPQAQVWPWWQARWPSTLNSNEDNGLELQGRKAPWLWTLGTVNIYFRDITQMLLSSWILNYLLSIDHLCFEIRLSLQLKKSCWRHLGACYGTATNSRSHKSMSLIEQCMQWYPLTRPCNLSCYYQYTTMHNPIGNPMLLINQFLQLKHIKSSCKWYPNHPYSREQ